MTNLSLLLLPVLLSGLEALGRNCTGDEECVLASNCTQYTEDSECLGFLPVDSEDYDKIVKGLDDQICAVNSTTGEEKVCCRNEVERRRPTPKEKERKEAFASPCLSSYRCKKINRTGRKFCCRPNMKSSSGKITCSGVRRCYAL